MAERGVILMKEAKAKTEESTFGSFFGFAPSKAQKMEEAAELYKKAGNSFKVSNNHRLAGDAYLKASESYKLSDGQQLETQNNLVEAATCYRKAGESEQAIRFFLECIDVYNDQGKFGYAAKYEREIADIYEADGNKPQALQFFERAVRSFQNDNKPSKVTENKLKCAVIYSEQNEFTRAANVFEEVGSDSLSNKLSSFSAKGYFLQSLLCHFAANDSVAVRTKFDLYSSKDHSFGSSREGLFVGKLLEAFEVANADDFATACAEYDRVTPLDPWKTNILVTAKGHIEEKEDDLS